MGVYIFQEECITLMCVQGVFNVCYVCVQGVFKVSCMCVLRLIEALPLSETWVSCPAFDRRREQLSRTCQTGADLDDPSLPVGHSTEATELS